MTTPKFQLDHLATYYGANIHAPQSGLHARIHAPHDAHDALRATLKEHALFVGIILAYLDVTATPTASGYTHDLTVTSPTPELAAATLRASIDLLNNPYDPDDPDDERDPFAPHPALVSLQKERRATAYPLTALHILAEAQSRAIPILHLPDEQVQLGYSSAGWQFTPRDMPRRPTTDTTEPPAHQPPWATLGSIPLYIVTGTQDTAQIVTAIATRLQAAGWHPTVRHNTDYASTRDLLADPTVTAAVCHVQTASILMHGVAFSTCTQAIIAAPADTAPAPPYTPADVVRAVGVPALLAQHATILADDPRLRALQPYLPHASRPLDTSVSHLVLPSR